MSDPSALLLAADALLVTHVLFVAFVVFGLVLILIGKLLSLRWVRNRWFRFAHLAAITVVVVQAWVGVICPLTTWEMSLRRKAGAETYDTTFMSHWLGKILYYDAPHWVFVVAYTVFGALVVFSWFWVRPGRKQQ